MSDTNAGIENDGIENDGTGNEGAGNEGAGNEGTGVKDDKVGVVPIPIGIVNPVSSKAVSLNPVVGPQTVGNVPSDVPYLLVAQRPSIWASTNTHFAVTASDPTLVAISPATTTTKSGYEVTTLNFSDADALTPAVTITGAVLGPDGNMYQCSVSAVINPAAPEADDLF